MNTPMLIFFIVLHWVFLLISILYVFVRKSNKYDMVYFTTICAILLSWQITGKECIINYWEKRSVDEKYIYGTNNKGHFLPEKYAHIIYTFIGVLKFYNLYIMMLLYKVPLPIKIMIFYLLLNIEYNKHLKPHIDSILIEPSFLIGYISLAVLVAFCS
jgi:hypothetical protein